MGIQTYNADGTTIVTGMTGEFYMLNTETSYKVFGDLIFTKTVDQLVTPSSEIYYATRLIYTPNGTSLGDVITKQNFISETEIKTSSWLRIKQGLSFNAKPYAYNTAYISNVKGGKDEEFSILGHTFNMANVKAGDFDMLFHSELFCVDLKENHIKQLFRANGQDIEINIPITVEGNKVTLDMSAENPAFRKVDMYIFQDADNSQLHMYMHTDAFINYYANMELYNLLKEGKITHTDTAAIEEVYANMEARVQSINVSFVFKAIK